MHIEYIGHSGVFVETESTNLLFDCIATDSKPTVDYGHDVGIMPKLNPNKTTVVFSSHHHGDHYNEFVWQLRERCPRIHFVISKGIHFSSGVRARLNITEADMPYITRVRGFTKNYIDLATARNVPAPAGAGLDLDAPAGAGAVSCTCSDSDAPAGAGAVSRTGSKAGSGILCVNTIVSNDIGVAFLVTVDGHRIFHAGDHNMWIWDSEGADYCAQIESGFRKSVQKLPVHDDTPIDVAFLLLDPRVENHSYDGLDTYLELLPIRNIVPIHQWRSYSITDDYLADRADFLAEHGTTLYKVTGENCSFEIE